MIRIHRKETGFTLLELLVGVAILSILGLVIFQFIRTSSQRMTMTKNSFGAIHAGAKVMSDLLEEARVNGTLFEVVTQTDQMRDVAPMVEARSFYFRNLWDLVPPRGFLDEGVDGGIGPTDLPAFDEFNPFSVEVIPRRIDEPTQAPHRKHLAEIGVRILWTERVGPARVYQLFSHLPSPVGEKPFGNSGLLPDEKLDSRIREWLFPDMPGMTFDQAVSQKACHRELAWQVGKLNWATHAITEALDSISSEIRVLEGMRKPWLTPPDPELVKFQLAIARRRETGASLVFTALNELRPTFEEVRRMADGDTLKKIPKRAFELALWGFRGRMGSIARWVEASRKDYEFLLQPSCLQFLSARECDFVRQKALEAHRLLVSIGEEAPGLMKQFLDRELQEARGKNPFRMRFLEREERHFTGAEVDTTSFKNLFQIRRIITEDFRRLSDEVPELVKRFPEAQ